jgi:hypothetical protein
MAFPMDVYNFFEDYVERSNGRYQIVNAKENRLVPPKLSKEEFIEHTGPAIQEIIDSKVKIVKLILAAPAVYWALELFYDLGMRAGDHVHISSFYMFSSVFKSDDKEELSKRLEVLTGAI